MSQLQSGSDSATKRNFAISMALSCYLIATFLWRAFTPAHEYPMRAEQMLEIGLDVLCVVGLIGLRKQVPQALFWIALLAGVSLFLIRLHGDASWWTGHWTYYLRPR